LRKAVNFEIQSGNSRPHLSKLESVGMEQQTNNQNMNQILINHYFLVLDNFGMNSEQFIEIRVRISLSSFRTEFLDDFSSYSQWWNNRNIEIDFVLKINRSNHKNLD
jgi:hypothetical protein